MDRKHVYFSGRVQGVGFRYVTRNIAGDYAIGGFVRNLPGGRVELVVQGPEKQVTAFLEELTEQLGRYIIEMALQDEPCGDEFDGFEIRY
jgi:acylphosphatase